MDRSSAIFIAIVSQIVFFQEIPNTLSIGGLVLVTLAVLVQGAKKLNLKLPEFIGKEKESNKEDFSQESVVLLGAAMTASGCHLDSPYAQNRPDI